MDTPHKNAKNMLFDLMAKFDPNKPEPDDILGWRKFDGRILLKISVMSWAERMKLYGDLRVKESQAQIISLGNTTGTLANVVPVLEIANAKS